MKTKTFILKYLWIVLKWKNVSGKSFRKKKRIMFSPFFFRKVYYEIMWKTMLEAYRSQMTI